MQTIFEQVNSLIEKREFDQAVFRLGQAYAERPGMISLLIKKFEVLAKMGDCQAAEMVLSEISIKKNDPSLIQNLFSYLKFQLTQGHASTFGGDSCVYPTGPGSWTSLRKILGRQSKMRVLFVHDDGFLSEAGMVMKQEVATFLQAGHIVGCVACHENGLGDGDLRSFKGGGVWVGMRLLAKQAGASRLPLREMVACAVEEIKKDQPDLVIWGSFDPQGWASEAREILRQADIPVVSHVHARGEKISHLIPCVGIDTNRFVPGDRREARRVLGIEEDDFVVLVGCGFGEPNAALLEIFEYYSTQRNVSLIPFGSPDRFLGFPNSITPGDLNREEVRVRLFQAVDLFVCPAQADRSVLPLLEAASCGCPIASSAEHGGTGVVRHGENAICVKRSDAESLIAGIEQIRASRELREDLSRGGRELAYVKFSLQQYYRAWEEYLRQLCEHRFELQSRASWKRKKQYAVLCEPFAGLEGTYVCGLRCHGYEKRDIDNAPLITIATIVYNAGASLTETVLSIISQDYPNLEWIVIDGGSNDGTLELISQYEDCVDLMISEPDKGIYDAMNKAAKLANGRWINYMNAGDFFCGADAVSRVFQHAPPDANVVYGHVFYRKPDGTQEVARADIFEKKWQALLEGDLFKKPWMVGLPPHQSTFMRTSTVRELKFDLSMRVSADWDLIFRARKAGVQFYRADMVVAVYRAGGFSAKHARLWVEEVWQIAQKHTQYPEKASTYFSPLVEEYKRLEENPLE